MSQVRQLSEEQIQAFDYPLFACKWDVIKAQIDHDFPNGAFRFLDVGGGNGSLTDMLLDAYPGCSGVLIDNSDTLIKLNSLHPRKSLVNADISELHSHASPGEFDVVFCHMLLHHLVMQSYRQTRNCVSTALNELRDAVKPVSGRLSVFEELYNGFPPLSSAPGRIIYELTSSRMLSRFCRRFGANTAGTGVCFRSQDNWLRTFEEHGLQVLDHSIASEGRVPLVHRMCLLVRSRQWGHFWMSPRAPR